MQNQNHLKINVLPSPTYSWLKMNEAELAVPAALREKAPELRLPEEVKRGRADHASVQDIAGGMGYDMDNLIRKSLPGVLSLSLAEHVTASAPVYLDFCYQGEEAAVSAVEISAGKGSRLTVIMNFSAAEGSSGFAAVQTKLRLSEEAELTLVQIQRMGDGFLFLNDVGVKAEEKARFSQLSLMLSGERSYHGSRTDLLGTGSRLQMDVGYLLKGREHLDMNFIANHIGRKTECDIRTDGVLRNEAFKLFRGTIDLRHGAKGAVGSEVENVLLMDDDVINQTIPVILCDEDDVEGNHGATIGRLDEELLFYLSSRGMDRESVYEMMAEARIDAVVRKITDEKTRASVYQSLGRTEEAAE